MRVLHLCSGMHPRDGGPPRVVEGLALALANAGIAVEIATIAAPEDEADVRAAWPALAAAGIPLHIFAISSPRVITRSSALNRFVKDQLHRFDLLHIHAIWETGLADAAAIFRHAGKPTVITTHGMLDRWQLKRSALKKSLAQRFLGTGAMMHGAKAMLFGSAEEASEAAGLGLPGRAVIVPNGVTLGEKDGDPAAGERLRDRFPALREWDRTVLFFSRLHPKKGLDLLVEAFGRVHRDFPGAGLLCAAIAQDQAYATTIRTRIAELQPANIVLVADPQGLTAQEAFAVADIFCLPSHQEGFSMAILEAAAAGLPELITDKCHIPEIAGVGAGLVVSDTVDAIEAGLRQLLAMDSASLVAMGRRGTQLIADHFTWGRIAERLIVTYGDVIDECRAPQRAAI